jgi:hypothetical protein
VKNVKEIKFTIIILFLMIVGYSNNSALIYPEHRDITLLAIQKLNQENRSLLDQLWMKARIGHEARLTESIIDTEQSIAPPKLDFASWAAIAGDHSCSPERMLSNILNSEWIMYVADVAAQLKIDLVSSEDLHEHLNALRDSDIKLQRVDPNYATRAGSNNVHFLLARPNANIQVRDYLIACLTAGAELNALGAYTWFHISALQKAAKSFEENLSDEERSALILAAFADEGFALHFLEDSFASGHTAGTWGNAAQRKGTHDYYNQKGLAATTWDGKSMVLTGDAFMRKEDAEIASKSVQMSLEQLIAAATGKLTFDYSINNTQVVASPDSFNTCKNNFMPERHVDKALYTPIADVLKSTPLPGLGAGLGEFPRFTAELGSFIGVVSALNSSALSNGFGTTQNNQGATAGIYVGIRVGLGLEGVMHGGGDGLVFIEGGWKQDASSTMSYGNSPAIQNAGQIASAIPGRQGLGLRYRMPFWLIPLDLLITAPIMIFAAPEAWTKMAVTAGLGGLIPWQAGIETSLGRFQFILGREIGVTLYGYGKMPDAILVPIDDTQTSLLNYKSTQFDFPVLEYRPFRTFSLDQSSSLVLQFNFGVDIPHDVVLVAPEGIDTPELRPVWYVGLRAAFDWRYYW